MEELKLADIIDTRDEQPPILVAFPGSSTFMVSVRPLTGNKHHEMVEEATEPVWDEALMKKTMKLNMERYLQLFGSQVCCGWQGLTVKELRRLVLISDFKKLRKATAEIAFDAEARRILITWSPTFKTWLQNTSLNVELFNREREEALKKKFWQR